MWPKYGKYKTTWTDVEIIEALNKYGETNLQPPNLKAFFANLPRPERDRLINEARNKH